MTRLGFQILALAFSASILVAGPTATLTGRVTDQDTGQPLGGVTVIVAGPQGEDAVITTEKGEYSFTTLPVGTYVIRFYAANTAHHPGSAAKSSPVSPVSSASSRRTLRSRSTLPPTTSFRSGVPDGK